MKGIIAVNNLGFIGYDNKIGNVTFPNLSNLNKECKIFNYQF